MSYISIFFPWKWCSASIVNSNLGSIMPIAAAQMEYTAHPHQFWSCDGEKADAYFPLTVFE